MNYQEAANALMEGKYVSRGTWSETGDYLVNLPGLTHFLRVSVQPKANVIPWAADIADTLATDWAISEPANKVHEPAAA